ncbi:hypothetical protein BDK51DRAFT_37284 [Blyttiomyces helicus]|uniref:Uncharacterized protein n=1 Tax=Blyttiomyces helicus TaxID=388810 RepID=A0A4P9W0E7_9FUNG|nr:hypothetical protein BDK51DRAFT_37284 [Blyttiomyces helicus]|eukprot:RKO84148.1 hypothetical protein BDK51DRAFT_37284 [Blyttiomyces helicus]
MVPPETVKFPDMFMFAPIATPPATVNASTEEDDEFVVFEIVKVPADDREDASDTDPEMVALPPDEIIDPVVTLEESAVLVSMKFPEAENEESVKPPAKESDPVIDRFPPIETLSMIPTPPEICKAPDEILVESIWLPTTRNHLRSELKEPIPVTDAGAADAEAAKEAKIEKIKAAIKKFKALPRKEKAAILKKLAKEKKAKAAAAAAAQ